LNDRNTEDAERIENTEMSDRWSELARE